MATLNWMLVNDLMPRIDKKNGFRCLLLLAFSMMLWGCATTPPQKPENICSVYKEKPAWHRVATKAEEKWGTSMHMVMSIMYQESAFVDDIRPPRRKLLGFIPWKRPSSAYGYSQALVGTWAHYQRDTGEGWRERDDFADARQLQTQSLAATHGGKSESPHP